MLRSILWFARASAALVLLGAASADAGAADSLPVRADQAPVPAISRAVTANRTPAYVLLTLNHRQVKWGRPKFGTGAVVRYAFVDQWVERPGAVNCGTIGPIGDHLSRSALGRSAFATEVMRAMHEWEAAVDIRFEPHDPASADLLIGIQKVPVGIAYTDIVPITAVGHGIATIRHAAICFNPDLPWESGFDGDSRTPDVRYVAGHEIGHVLGLDHAWGSDKLMDFNYREAVRVPQKDDLAGAEFLYGRNGAGGHDLVVRRMQSEPAVESTGSGRVR